MGNYFSIMSTTERSTTTAAFMKRDLNRIVGFHEVVVPSLVDEFRFHFRMTKNIIILSKYLRKSWQLKVQFLQEIDLGETDSTTEADFGFSLKYMSNMEVHIMQYKCSHARSHVVDIQKRELSGHAYGSKLAQGLELVAKSKWYTNFRSEILVGNFGLPLKTFRLFRKFSGRANQNNLTIYIPTEISGFFW